jgi:hypothetical protein
LPLDLSDPQHPKPGTPALLLDTDNAAMQEVQLSPDGKWISYRTGTPQNQQLEVRPFPMASSAKWSIGSGGYARWHGNQLFYIASDNRIMVVDYAVKGSDFIPSKPRVWSETRVATLSSAAIDIAPDGRIIAFEALSETRGNLHATFLLNFFDEVRRLIP